MGSRKVLTPHNEEVLIFESLISSKIRSGGPQTAQYKGVLIYRGYTVVVNSGHTVYSAFNEKNEKKLNCRELDCRELSCRWAQLSRLKCRGSNVAGSTVGAPCSSIFI